MDYTLKPNPLAQRSTAAEGTAPYLGELVPLDERTADDLIKDLTSRGSILKPTEIKAVLDAYWEQIGAYLAQGYTYRDAYVHVTASMTGTFASQQDRYEAPRHGLKVHARLQNPVVRLLKQVKLRYTAQRPREPWVQSVVGLQNPDAPKALMAGKLAEVRGALLKLWGTHPEEGVFFVPLAAGQPAIRAERLITNQNTTLLLEVPTLPPGPYHLEVRNTARKGTRLRTGRWPDPVEVVAE